MSYLYRPFGLLFMLLMIVLGLQVTLRSPLCIESNVVYKIDKIGVNNAESIYSCSQFKRVFFSGYFFENLNNLQSRVSKLELLMNELGMANKFIIVIDDVNKKQIHELINGVQIGTELMAGNQLEKLLLMKSLKNKTNITDLVFLETISDFLIGDSNYQNLISEAWGEMFMELKFLEKLKISKLIIRQLRQITAADGLGAAERLRLLLSSSFNQNAATLFGNKLRELGYYTENELSELRLDIIIEGNRPEKSLNNLTMLAKKFKNLKTAVKNSQGLYLLPSNLKIPAALENRISVRHRIIFNTQNKAKFVMARYLDNTESLVLINSDSSSANIDMTPLYAAGIGDFLSRNKRLEFIQFHLPSYRLIYKNLSRIANYFDFVRNKNNSEKEHKILGWGRTEWLTDLRAYRPIANYDVIQYFRIN